MTKEILSGQEAIDEFCKLRPDGLIEAWWYSPNGGCGNATGQRSIYTQEEFREFLFESELDEDVPEYRCNFEPVQFWDSVEFNGEELKFSYVPEGMCPHQFVTFYVAKPEGYEGEAVACFGAHYGFGWGSSCPEIDVFSDFPQSSVLETVICNTDPEKIGLEEIDDPTDDGKNWIIADREKFLAVAKKCATAQRKVEAWDVELSWWTPEGIGRLIAEKLNQ